MLELTMALYRKHRSEWEKLPGHQLRTKGAKSHSKESNAEQSHRTPAGQPTSLEIKPATKRKRIEELEEHPGEGVKGFSSGLTTVIKKKSKAGVDSQWWTTLNESRAMEPTGGGPKGGSKGGIRIKF